MKAFLHLFAHIKHYHKIIYYYNYGIRPQQRFKYNYYLFIFFNYYSRLLLFNFHTGDENLYYIPFTINSFSSLIQYNQHIVYSVNKLI